MKHLEYHSANGDFTLRHAEKYPDIYFPLVSGAGMMSSISPMLSGDCKTSQETFLLAPASRETLHESRASRNFWVSLSGEKPWSVCGQSAPQQAAKFSPDGEETVLTGGLLWQKITRENRNTGLKADVLSFVPAGDDKVEIMQVTLTNMGSRDLRFRAAAAIPVYGRSADNIRDHRHVTSLLHRVEMTRFGLDVKPTMTFDERGHQPGNVTYRVWGAEGNGNPPEGFIPMVDDFIGSGSYDWPEALVDPCVAYSCCGDTAEGYEVVGALFFRDKTLASGESCTYQIVLAVDDDPRTYLDAKNVDKALEKTKAWWQKKCAQQFTTGDAQFDAWMRWVGIQPTLRRICGCSFLPHHDYGRGGRGWRDLWQDSLALLLSEPKGVREDLVRYFAGVRLDGTNATIIGTRPGEFKADRNGIPRVWMDHGFWPLLTTKLYLDETGDYDFLMESQPYFSDTLAYRGQGKPKEQAAPVQFGTVLEHLLTQSVTAFFDIGEHGHIRLRGGDWNDGLDMARNRGESVAFTAAYAYNLEILSHLCELLEHKGIREVTLRKPLAHLIQVSSIYYGYAEDMQTALLAYCKASDETVALEAVSLSELTEGLYQMSQWIKKHIDQTEWTGDDADLHWFNSYYDDNGRPAEGGCDKNVRMMLTGQVFCLLSGTADEEKAKEIIRTADWYLCDPARGGYFLNTDFREVKLDLGRMFGFAYGHKENGAVFCHMAVMYAYALYERGFAAAGARVLDYLYRQCAAFEQSRILPGIPEYFDLRGKGMYPYLTGAASWLLLTMQKQVFGVCGMEGGLQLRPQLLASQFGENAAAEILCTAIGRRIQVRYENPMGLDWEEYQIETVTCQDRIWTVNSPAILIDKSELPETEELLLTVTLAPRD